MNFRTMMQAGPVRANELFGKLAETSDAAVRNRGKLFAELKGELEQHMRMEQDHLLPILRKNAATKDLAAEAVKDNRELRTRLVELEGLPKNDAAFPNRLAELRKAFRQHARNDRKELLPVVQQALKAECAHEDAQAKPGPESTPQIHQSANGQASPTAGIEPSLAAAAQAKQHEAAQRQSEAARERTGPAAGDPAQPESSLAAAVQAKQNEAEQRQAEAARQQAARRLAGGAGPAPAATENAHGPVAREANLAAAVLAKQNELEQQARQRSEQERQAAIAASQEQVRQRLELAEREAAAERLRQAAIRPAAEVAAAAGEGARRMAGTMAAGTAQVGATLREAGQSTLDAMRRVTPDLRTATAVPGLAANGMAELGSAWFGFLGRQAAANTRLTRDLAERQRQFAASAWRSLMDANQQAIGITLGMARQGATLSAAAAARGGNHPARPGTAQGAARPSTTQSGSR